MSSSVPARVTAFALLASGVMLIAGCPSATQGLTQEDIAALEEQGQREGWTFDVSLNPATDYGVEELLGDDESLLPPAPEKMFAEGEEETYYKQENLPTSWDWRQEAGGLPPVEDQDCRDCWAFATNGVVQSLIKIRDGIEVDLSEQYLVDACPDYGCDGGSRAFRYYFDTPTKCDATGAVLEADFPYRGWEDSPDCPYPYKYWLTSWGYVSSDKSSVSQIKQAILTYGPVYVSVKAGYAAFRAYDEGIFNYDYDGTGTDHGVVLVGWDDAQGSEGVWILRNSWGPDWGEDGYMRIEYGASNVGRWPTYAVYEGGRSDLVVSFLTYAPSSPTSEDVITFTVEVTNQGDGTAGPSVVSLQVGGETTPSAFPVPVLAPNESYSTERQASLPGQNYRLRSRAKIS